MALKLFTQTDGAPQFIVKDFNHLIEEFKRSFTETCPGAQIIDFESPAKYFASLRSTEEELGANIIVADLSELTELIEQQINEQN